MKFKLFLSKSIKRKILVPMITLLILLGITSFEGISGMFEYTNTFVQKSNTVVFDKAIKQRTLDNINMVYSSISTVADRALQEASFFTKIPVVQKAYTIALSGNIEDEKSPEVQQAREMLRKELKPFLDGYKEQTGRTLLKLHFHLPNGRSLVRLWREGYQTIVDGKKVDISDDISSFRSSVVQINKNPHTPITGIEIGRGGFSIRGIAPLTKPGGQHLGSVEILFDFNEIFNIINRSDQVQYAVYMNVDQLPIAESLADHKKYPVLEGSYVLTDATNSDITASLVSTDILNKGKEKIYSEKIGNYVVSTFPIKDFSGQSVGVMFLSMDISDQLSEFKANTRALNDFSHSVIRNTGIVFIFAVILLSLIVYFILNRVLVSLYNFQELFSRGARGDLSVRSANKSEDEIGNLSIRFNGFMEQLGTTVTKIKESAERVDAVKNSLVASSEETSATVKNIKKNITSLLKESENMDTNAADNTASLKQITESITDIKNQINEQASMVEESAATITEMISSLQNVDIVTRKNTESVLRLVQAIKAGNDASAATDQKFQVDVIEKIDGISEMAETIQTIASQTNLLSMNAAIEAAHAGDAGKGFAVVAAEIRKLADTASRSSSSITKTIKEISEGIAGTGIVAQKKVDAFAVMNREIKTTRDAFDEIAASIQEINAGGTQVQEAMVLLREVSLNIKNAASEMTTGAEKVMMRQFDLKNISNHLNKGMIEINYGSDEIVIASDEIVQQSLDLNATIKDLNEETKKFRI